VHIGYPPTKCTRRSPPAGRCQPSRSEPVPNPTKFWTRGVRNIVGRQICPNYCTSSLWNRKYLSTELFISFSVEIYSVPSPKAPTPCTRIILASDFHQLNIAKSLGFPFAAAPNITPQSEPEVETAGFFGVMQATGFLGRPGAEGGSATTTSTYKQYITTADDLVM
jgi:hypothetical protein